MAQASSTVALARADAAPNRISLPLLRVQERRLLLSVVDGLLVGALLVFGYDVWKAGVHPGANNMASMPWAWVLGGAGGWLLISWLAGAYDLEVADGLRSSAKRTMLVGFVGALSAFAAYWVFLKTYPRPALAFVVFAAPIGVLLWRSLYALAISRPASATRILVVGGQDAYDQLLQATATRDNYYRIVGSVEAEDLSGDGRSCLDDWIARTGAHRIVVAPRTRLTTSIVMALTKAIECGLEVDDFNAAYEEISEKLAVEHVGDQWLASLPTRSHGSTYEEMLMRAMDVLGAAVGLLLTGLAFPFIALAIKLTSSGPICYAQHRLGRTGRVFTIYKFRSMHLEAEKSGAQWAGHCDPRVTRVGAFLRRSHLDELPQFWNVLKGDMSLVGPRPERPEFTETLSEQIPFYRLRLSARPGLTGLKQIKVGYAASVEEHLEVLRHDLYYLKHRSPALNLNIIARTLGSVFGRDGR